MGFNIDTHEKIENENLKRSRDGLFEEFAENNYNLGVNPKTGEWGIKEPKSLWILFLYAIQHNPMLKNLKDIIDRANDEKSNWE